MAVVTNEEELNAIQEALIKKKYKNIDTSTTIVGEEEKKIVKKKLEKK